MAANSSMLPRQQLFQVQQSILTQSQINMQQPQYLQSYAPQHQGMHSDPASQHSMNQHVQHVQSYVPQQMSQQVVTGYAGPTPMSQTSMLGNQRVQQFVYVPQATNGMNPQMMGARRLSGARPSDIGLNQANQVQYRSDSVGHYPPESPHEYNVAQPDGYHQGYPQVQATPQMNEGYPSTVSYQPPPVMYTNMYQNQAGQHQIRVQYPTAPAPAVPIQYTQYLQMQQLQQQQQLQQMQPQPQTMPAHIQMQTQQQHMQQQMRQPAQASVVSSYPGQGEDSSQWQPPPPAPRQPSVDRGYSTLFIPGMQQPGQPQLPLHQTVESSAALDNSTGKRKKKPLVIINPVSNEEVLLSTSRSGSPKNSSDEAQSQQIRSQFASKVLARLSDPEVTSKTTPTEPMLSKPDLTSSKTTEPIAVAKTTQESTIAAATIDPSSNIKSVEGMDKVIISEVTSLLEPSVDPVMNTADMKESIATPAPATTLSSTSETNKNVLVNNDTAVQHAVKDDEQIPETGVVEMQSVATTGLPVLGDVGRARPVIEQVESVVSSYNEVNKIQGQGECEVNRKDMTVLPEQIVASSTAPEIEIKACDKIDAGLTSELIQTSSVSAAITEDSIAVTLPTSDSDNEKHLDIIEHCVSAKEIASEITCADGSSTAPTTLDGDNWMVTTLDGDNVVEDSVLQNIAAVGAAKLKYKEGQWSPLNPTGSKKYDSVFLREIEKQMKNCSKPKDLPDLPDVVLDNPLPADYSPQPMMTQSASSPNFVDFMLPGYAKPSMQGRNINMINPMMGGFMGRGGPGGQFIGMGMGMPGGMRFPIMPKPEPIPSHRIIRLPDMNRAVALNRTENAWKPGKFPDENLDPEELKTQLLYKTVRSILNKITPQKLDVLIDKVMGLEIDTEERLAGVIGILFEKAISEPNFCPAYARLAHRMFALKVPLTEKLEGKPPEQQVITFRKLLLNRCQAEFEKDELDELDNERRQKEIEETIAEDKKAELEAAMEEASVQSRRRSLGNVRFIAELFKLKMLTENIMHDCLRKLLKNQDEDSLECLCRLLLNIGKDLDSVEKGKNLEAYFSQIKMIAYNKNKSARIRFMLQDVIELRNNKWVPRRADNNPKTIEQIHSEAETEKMEKEIMIRNLPPSGPPSNMGPPSSRGRPPGHGSGGAPQVGPDGWTAVPSKSQRPEKIDSSKILKLSKMSMDENVMLGPGQRPGASWGSGSRGGGSNKTADNDNLTPSNRYAALQGSVTSGGGRNLGPQGRGRGSFPQHMQDEQRSASASYGRISPRFNTPGTGNSREGSRESSRSRDPYPDEPIMMSRGGERNTPTPPQNESLVGSHSSSLYASPRGSQTGSRDSSRSRGPTPPPPSSQHVEELTDYARRRIEGIIREFWSQKDIEEACLSFHDLKLSSDVKSSCISFMINAAFETNVKQTSERKSVGGLLSAFLERQLFSTDQLNKGLQAVILTMPDLVVDIPKGWEYLGDILSTLIASNFLTLQFIVDTCEPLADPEQTTALLLAHVLLQCAEDQGKEAVRKLWSISQFSWSDILPASSVDKFLADKDLHFLSLGSISTEDCDHSTSDRLPIAPPPHQIDTNSECMDSLLGLPSDTVNIVELSKDIEQKIDRLS